MADVIVRIWWFKSWVAYETLGAGHGSVEFNRPRAAYITWLGSDMWDQIIAGTWDYANDLNHFGGNYEEIRIPLRDRETHCGLSADAMLEWWDARKRDAPWYWMISKTRNCDATVVLALIAGGAEAYVPSPTNIVYQGAASLLRWAKDLRARMLNLEKLIAGAANVVQAAVLGGGWLPNNTGAFMPEIWSVSEWKKRSSVTLGMRREQVAAIDVLLAQYHAFAPSTLTLGWSPSAWRSYTRSWPWWSITCAPSRIATGERRWPGWGPRCTTKYRNCWNRPARLA